MVRGRGAAADDDYAAGPGAHQCLVEFHRAHCLGIGTAALEPVSTFAVAMGTRAALAAYSATSTAVLRERGREGLFVWTAADLSALVAADPAQGIHVASATDPTGASGAWVRKFTGPVNPEWFGVVQGSSNGVNGAANSSAFAVMQAALRARGTAGFQARGIEAIRFPSASTYEFASTIELTDGSWLLEGVGAPSDEGGTLLKFPQGVTGIRVQRANTAGAGATRTLGETAEASIIRNLRLKGAYAGAEAEAHGIHLRASARLKSWSSATSKATEFTRWRSPAAADRPRAMPTSASSSGCALSAVAPGSSSMARTRMPGR